MQKILLVKEIGDVIFMPEVRRAPTTPLHELVPTIPFSRTKKKLIFLLEFLIIRAYFHPDLSFSTKKCIISSKRHRYDILRKIRFSSFLFWLYAL